MPSFLAISSLSLFFSHVLTLILINVLAWKLVNLRVLQIWGIGNESGNVDKGKVAYRRKPAKYVLIPFLYGILMLG